MKLILTIILLHAFTEAKSQAPPWEWARTTTGSGVGNGWQESYSIATDGIGNVYLSGFFNDSILTIGSFTLTNNGTNNVLIAKYDSMGNVLWARSSSGAGDNEANCIAVDGLGNSYMTGKFSSPFIVFDSDTLFNSGIGTNIFIVKYDSFGNEIWARSGKGTGTNIGTSITVDAVGAMYMTGIYNSPTIIFDTDTLVNTAAGFTDMFVIKFNTIGSVVWAKNFQGNWAEFSRGIFAGNSGNIYLTGDFSSPELILNSDTLSSVGSIDIFVAKLDSSGSVIWAKSFGTHTGENSYSIAEDGLGDIYFTGAYYADTMVFESDTLFNSGLINVFLTKLDSLGNVIWAKTSSGPGNAFGYCVIADSLGSAYICGGFNTSTTLTFDTITLPFPSNGFDPMFIVKYNSSGNVIWGKSEASGGDDQSRLAFGKNGSIYFGGDFYNINPFILGCDTLIRTSSECLFVSKLGHILCPEILESVSHLELENLASAFPNPFDNHLQVTYDGDEEVEVVIYDFLFRNLLQHRFKNSILLNTDQFVNGIYLFEIRKGNGIIERRKLIKQ